MKKLFLSAIAATAMLMAACHQQASTTSADSAAGKTADTAKVQGLVNGPMMKFEFESHDFGKIKEGDKVTYKFNFANVGKSPLIITNAVASCGCTIPEWPKTPIKAGDGGQIIVTFNSAGKKGLQDKQITITANTTPAQNVVHLVGEVLEKK